MPARVMWRGTLGHTRTHVLWQAKHVNRTHFIFYARVGITQRTTTPRGTRSADPNGQVIANERSLGVGKSMGDYAHRGINGRRAIWVAKRPKSRA